VKVYLDLCCLKRPFDDQTQARIAVETVAVLAILDAIRDGRIQTVRSPAHELENSQNPDSRRAAAVSAWLDLLNPLEPTPPSVAERTRFLVDAGFGQLDAFHLAWAEYLGVDSFVTTDDQLIARAARAPAIISLRVLNPVSLIAELPA
jgi:predicted nucleic acid-binding protein